MIEVQDIHKHFNQGGWWKPSFKPVLAGLSFDVPNGSITGLIGRNGAGKTTTFNLVAGLLRADQGQVRVDGYDPLQDPFMVRCRLGLLPEHPGLSKPATGEEAILESSALHGLHGALLRQRLLPLVDELDLGAFWKRPCGTYSRGQAVRVALARVLVLDTPNLILDEPTVGLDFESAKAVRRIVRAQAANGKAVVVATHIVSEIRTLCHRVVGLEAGRAAAPERVEEWLDDADSALREEGLT